jgi:hypothetical protein
MKTARSSADLVRQTLADFNVRAWDALRPCAHSPLLDLHLSLRASRRGSNDHGIDFDGRPSRSHQSKKPVTILFHPKAKLWVLEEPPSSRWPTILGPFAR